MKKSTNSRKEKKPQWQRWKEAEFSRSIWSCLILLWLSTAPGSAEQFGLFTYSVNGEGATISDYPNRATGAVEIPAEIDGKPVVRIGSYAFENCAGITSVTIPDSIISIADDGFQRCGSLTSVTIGNGVTTIGKEAFEYCTSLTTITFPDSIIEIKSEAFKDCIGLTSVTIPDSVTSLGAEVFKDCFGLASVEIGGSVPVIWPRVFEGCVSLTSVTIPDSVFTISADGFSECSALTSIEVSAQNTNFSSLEGVLFSKDQTVLHRFPEGRTGEYAIPNTVTGIGNFAFFNCSGLTSVMIPDSVPIINSRAFYGCTNLINAIFLGNAPSNFHLRAFDDTAPDFTISYLSGSSGFTSPTWNGYPTTLIAPATELSPISSVSLSPAGTRLAIHVTIENLGLYSRNVGVEYSPDLQTGPWIDLGDFTPEGSNLIYLDSDSERRALPSGYYRAILRPLSP
jgi:hypothetical protein